VLLDTPDRRLIPGSSTTFVQRGLELDMGLFLVFLFFRFFVWYFFSLLRVSGFFFSALSRGALSFLP